MVHVKRTGQARCPQANGRRTGNNGIDLKQEVSNRNNPKHVKSGITTDWVENEWQTIFRTAITSKGCVSIGLKTSGKPAYRIAITSKGVCIDWAENDPQTNLPHSFEVRHSPDLTIENDPQTNLPHSLRWRSYVVCLPVVKAACLLNRG